MENEKSVSGILTFEPVCRQAGFSFDLKTIINRQWAIGNRQWAIGNKK
jgi:hypothetical protein